MDGIYLSRREKRFLFVLRFKKRIKPKFDVSKLASYGLISESGTWVVNESGKQVFDRVYSLTDDAVRYRIAKRQDRWQRIVTPIFVSVASSVITAAITAVVTVLLMEQ